MSTSGSSINRSARPSEAALTASRVDLNTASWALLRYIAGINERTAKKIVEYRNDNGRFRSRVQLMAVPPRGLQ
jgi:uncharacterized protein